MGIFSTGIGVIPIPIYVYFHSYPSTFPSWSCIPIPCRAVAYESREKITLHSPPAEFTADKSIELHGTMCRHESNMIGSILLRLRKAAEYCKERVCASVSPLSPELGRHVPSSPSFLCTLLVAVAWSSSGGEATCYALPILWMTSYFPPMGTSLLGADRTLSRSIRRPYLPVHATPRHLSSPPQQKTCLHARALIPNLRAVRLTGGEVKRIRETVHSNRIHDNEPL